VGALVNWTAIAAAEPLVTDMATVKDSCQGAGNMVGTDDPICIMKTDTEHCETVVPSWHQFR
jgi:hypothetical protein